MCTTQSNYLIQRRRSDSISLTIYQWSNGNRSPSYSGSNQSIISSSPPQPRMSSPELENRSLERSTGTYGGEDLAYQSRRDLFRSRSISGSSLDSLSRTIATQTPTEDMQFIFPDVDMEGDDHDLAPQDYNTLRYQPDLMRASPLPFRRHSLIGLVMPTNVARSSAMDIPAGGRRTLTHSRSYNGVGYKETSLVGKELRSIADAFDQIGGRVR